MGYRVLGGERDIQTTVFSRAVKERKVAKNVTFVSKTAVAWRHYVASRVVLTQKTRGDISTSTASRTAELSYWSRMFAVAENVLYTVAPKVLEIEQLGLGTNLGICQRSAAM